MPSGPGHFWIWQPKDAPPCEGHWRVARVWLHSPSGEMRVTLPGVLEDALLDSHTLKDARWFGPIEQPAHPNS